MDTSRRTRRTVGRLLALQCAAGVVVAALFAGTVDMRWALSALAGAATCVVATLPYAMRVAFGSNRSAGAGFATLVWGEGLKVAITVAVFAVVLVKLKHSVAALPLLTGYAAATSSWLFALLTKE
jgi:F0F1-type ATP synthase assembly protein I